MSFTGKSYSKVQTGTASSTSSTKAVEESKKKASLLKDNSWIRSNVNEDKKVESDTNYGKTVLGRYKSTENLVSPQDKTSKTESKTTTVITSPGSSVQALSKRFGGSQDKLNETRTIGTKTTVKPEPRTSTTTKIKDGAKITETTVTTTKQDVVKSSTKSGTITDKDLVDIKTKSSGDYKTEVITVKSSKDTVDGPTSPVKTTTSIKTYTKEDVSPTKKTYSVRSTKSTEDQLFDTLIPTSIKSSYTKPKSSDYKTEVVTVKSSKEIVDVPSSPVKTTTSIKTYTKEDVSPTKTTSYSNKSDYKTEVVTVKSSKEIIDVPSSPLKTTTSIKTYTKEDVSPTKTTSYSNKSDYKTEVVTVKSSKDITDAPTSPLKTTTSIKTYTKEDVSPTKTTSYSNKSDYKTEVVTVKSSKDIIDVPSSPLKTTTSIKTYTKEDVSPTKTTSYSTKSDYKTEVVTVKSSKEIIDVPTSPVKTTTSIKTYTKEDVSPTKTTSYSLRSTKSTEDQLYDTLLPTSITSSYSKHDGSHEDVSVSKTIRTVYSTNDRNEWSTVTSPSYTRTSYTESRPVDYLSDSLTSKTTTTVYTTPERTVSAKDICTYCHKNMYTDEKIVLDDMNINCHARCFKCGVCNSSLGHLKAGDSLWVYRREIHCESCFGVTRGKWIS
ncbi:sciellin isoform X1 [Ctenopharyngodon idella]|uniref:sciellin isoform X1 n=1 Tax=Ctenopharyngodon idella TaxID=7959 RepID=UPI00222FBCF0|nr:sciellin isoform X1 [Ctenopharyngodon idella]XP_051761895.1 sciellin isoform X1 [Ctenopharyngodon idella]